MTPQPPPRLPSAGPEPVEIAAILGVGFGWLFGGIGTLVGIGALIFAPRWSVSQRVIAIAGPLAAGLAPLALLGTSVNNALLGLVALGLWIAGSIAAAIYLWFTLPGRDGSVG